MPKSITPNTNDSTVMDLLQATYPFVVANEGGFEVICNDTQYYLSSDLLANKTQKKTGPMATWDLLYKKGGNAKHVELFEGDSIGITDVMAKGHATWCQFQTAVAWERRELLDTRNNPEGLYDLLKARRVSEQLAMVDTLEDGLWSAPADSEDAKLTPMGIPFWIQKNDSATTNGGWDGGDPTGFASGAGGLAVATAPGWKNYVCNYDAVSDTDLFRKMNYAAERLNFRMPELAKDLPKDKKPDLRAFCNLETKIAIKEKLLDRQTGMVGWAVDPVKDKVTFMGAPLEYVPALDADSDDPIYLVDMGCFMPLARKGDYFQETGPGPVAGAHNTIAMFIDLSYQWVCVNRKKCAVFHK